MPRYWYATGQNMVDNHGAVIVDVCGCCERNISRHKKKDYESVAETIAETMFYGTDQFREDTGKEANRSAREHNKELVEQHWDSHEAMTKDCEPHGWHPDYGDLNNSWGCYHCFLCGEQLETYDCRSQCELEKTNRR